MVMSAEPIVKTLKQIDQKKLGKVLFMSPQGERLNQNKVISLSKLKNITIICGRYEGIDQRVIDKYVDEEISVGDFVLSGGEYAAICLIDAISRHIPGTLGNKDSYLKDTFSNGLLKGDVYTKPENFDSMEVPEVLLSGNHKKIGYISGWEGASTQRDREAGFISCLANSGMTLHNRQVGNFVMEEAKEATRKMFSLDPPDAVFIANDHMALAVMDTLRYELGLRIPQDVSVIGYDDVPASAWPAYDLTTVRQPVNKMVEETVGILMKKINNTETKSRRVKIDGPLIIRGSARLPGGWGS